MASQEETEAANPVSSGAVELVAFSLGDRRYAVPLETVIRVERAVAITPLPQAPAIITGIIDFHGQVIPVADVRRRLGIPPRTIELSDQLLLLNTPKRTIAFLVDVVDGVRKLPQDRLVDAETVLAGLDYVRGILKIKDGMVLIHDPETFLSLEEERTLDEALRGTEPESAAPADGRDIRQT